MTIPAAFARIAVAFSRAGLGAYYDSEVRWPGTPVIDAGGSITSPGVPIAKPCQVQVDSATESMRGERDFRDTDVSLLVLCDSLAGEIDTDATVEVLGGPNAGRWSVESAGKDSMGTHWLCRGRRA